MAVAPRQSRLNPIRTSLTSAPDLESLLHHTSRNQRRNSLTATAQPERKVVSIEQARGKYRQITSLQSKPTQLPKPDQKEPAKGVPGQPAWLRSLTLFQFLSSGVAGLLVGVTLVAYGMTVYMESLWTKEYQTLEELRTEEQQLRAAGEVLKHKIAQEADQPNTGLVPRQPINMIFLRPAPLRPETNLTPVPTLEPDLQIPVALPEKPLAY
ncbi:MAG: hypothetical protein ACRC8A_09115 [Microcoleaceae cyanobacterium]